MILDTPKINRERTSVTSVFLAEKKIEYVLDWRFERREKYPIQNGSQKFFRRNNLHNKSGRNVFSFAKLFSDRLKWKKILELAIQNIVKKKLLGQYSISSNVFTFINDF